MAFQSGRFYSDLRPVPQFDKIGALHAVTSSQYMSPTSWSTQGLILAYADFSTAPSGGAGQPFCGPTGAITFDGRLDNREDLLFTLRDQFSGDATDAALALAAYRAHGADGFSRLVGDWSLALYDATLGQLLLASDFAGIRPLYYCISPGSLLWSTRLKPLVEWARPNRIDDDYIAGYLAHGGYPNRTPYRGIRSVPPGHVLVVSRYSFSIQRFWQFPIGNIVRFQEEYQYEERLREIFAEAVRSRLSTVAPSLVELSGGLDSSSIVCFADRLIKSGSAGAGRMITLTYDHSGSLDTRFCAAVEELCECENVHIPISGRPLLTQPSAGDPLPEIWDDLSSDIAKVAGDRGAQALITGSLGDLLMGNTSLDIALLKSQFQIGNFKRALGETVRWSRIHRAPVPYLLWRLLRTAPCEVLGSDHSIATELRNRADSVQNALSRSWVQAPPEQRQSLRRLNETFELRRLQPPPPITHLAFTHPYADRRLIEFLISIPPEIICRLGERRRLMRRAFSPLWPLALRQRKSKNSFEGTFYKALHPIATEMLGTLHRLQVVQRGYIAPEHFRRRLERLLCGLECNQPQLRRIIALELWLRTM